MIRLILIVGWLTLFSLSAHAVPPSTEWVGRESPPVKKQSPAKTDNSQPQTPPPPASVIIVETPEQKSSRQAAETNSRDHEAADLEAQRKGADAAERSAIAAEWQKVLSYHSSDEAGDEGEVA